MRLSGAGIRRPALHGRRLAGGFCCLLLGLIAVLLVVIELFRWLPVPTSAFILARRIDRLRDPAAVPPIRHQWVDLEEISPQIQLAVLAAEDQRFFDHRGFDLTAIGRAIDHNSRSRRLRGASTISQQTVKNLFLWGGRSYLRKALEAGLTLAVELLWPKRRILEVYLNSAEFGDGIYGVQAASRHHFGTTASQLNRQEAALLAAVLPGPRRFHADRPSPWVRHRAEWISSQMDRLDGPAFLARLEPPKR